MNQWNFSDFCPNFIHFNICLYDPLIFDFFYLLFQSARNVFSCWKTRNGLDKLKGFHTHQNQWENWKVRQEKESITEKVIDEKEEEKEKEKEINEHTERHSFMSFHAKA